MKHRCLTVALACLVLTRIAGAQTIAGRVTERTTGLPVAGVVVSAVDARGAVLTRAVTDASNGYRISALPGIARLQFRRIGFSPASIAIADTGNARLDIVMNRLPVQLPPVKAVVLAQCDPRPDRAEALALWEEARSALLTSITARESRPASATVYRYFIEHSDQGASPQHVVRRDLTSISTAFRAGLDAATLARRGYLDERGNRADFIGPDDAVLFDDSFLATHCFSMGRLAAGDDSTIALSFEPGKGRKVVDIAGTVFLRRDPLDLRAVEFTYTNVDRRRARANPGGSLRFGTMPNGITMLRDWSIRSPAAAGSGNGPQAIANEAGAIIRSMDWADGKPYDVPFATVTGIATDKFAQRPLANVPVQLANTPFTATTDSTGAFVIRGVLPGRYEVNVGDPLLAVFDAHSPLAGPFEIPPDSADLRFEAEGPLASAYRGCLAKVDGRVDMRPAAGSKVVFGQFQLSSGRLARYVTFEATIVPSEPGMLPVVLKGRSDRVGRFRLCGLPLATVAITASDEGLTGAAEVVIDAENPYRIVQLRLAPRPPHH